MIMNRSSGLIHWLIDAFNCCLIVWSLISIRLISLGNSLTYELQFLNANSMNLWMLIPSQAEEENLAAKTAIRTQHKELESWYPGDPRMVEAGKSTQLIDLIGDMMVSWSLVWVLPVLLLDKGDIKCLNPPIGQHKRVRKWFFSFLRWLDATWNIAGFERSPIYLAVTGVSQGGVFFVCNHPFFG